MKKLLLLLSIFASTSVFAQYHHHYHNGYNRYYGPNWNWVVPAVIGGAIVYGATRPAPPPPPTVIYVPPTLPPPPVGYHYEQLLDGSCNCYRWVLVQG